MKSYFHATTEHNFESIKNDGEIKTGWDGVVYLADSAENALKFISIRAMGKPIVVLEVELDENDVEETFDHSFSFFKCKAYGYPNNICLSCLVSAVKYSY